MSLLHLSVSEFNEIMADIIQNQLKLSQLCLSGEVTQMNFYSQRKHLYFTLTHKNSHIQCVIYNQHLKKLPLIEKGMKCKVIGQCQYLKNKGQLIFSGVSILLDGTGEKDEIFKKRLEKFKKEGKLSQKTSDQIPNIIEKICIITAENSAAYFDICKIIKMEPHTFETFIVPSVVQGLLAPNNLVDAIEIAESYAPDLICISRGGGAEQDFDCFNSEMVANACYKSKVPIITGIGHEINTTLTCLCANQYFSTPTAMAQWLVQHSMEPLNHIISDIESIYDGFMERINEMEMQLNDLRQLANTHIEEHLNELTQHIKSMAIEIEILNPIKKLNNGFIYCETENKKAIKTIHQLTKNDTIFMTLANGKAKAKINHVSKK
mgnify:CR=1 FL=1